MRALISLWNTPNFTLWPAFRQDEASWNLSWACCLSLPTGKDRAAKCAQTLGREQLCLGPSLYAHRHAQSHEQYMCACTQMHTHAKWAHTDMHAYKQLVCAQITCVHAHTLNTSMHTHVHMLIFSLYYSSEEHRLRSQRLDGTRESFKYCWSRGKGKRGINGLCYHTCFLRMVDTT